MNRYLKDHDNKERSKPHRRIETCLDEEGINYKSEEYFSPYTLDVYLPEWHIGIEVDGPFHSATKDKVRDRYLEEMYGLVILRINMKYWNPKNSIKNKIRQFIEEQADSSDERKTVWKNWLTAH